MESIDGRNVSLNNGFLSLKFLLLFAISSLINSKWICIRRCAGKKSFFANFGCVLAGVVCSETGKLPVC